MVVALKNSMRPPPIHFSCVQLEQRKMSPFSFLLYHTLIVFLSIFSDCTSQVEALSFLCFLLTLKLTHNSQKWLFFFSLTQGEMALASFFSFSSACPTRFASLLLKEVRLLTSLGHFSTNEKASFEDFRNNLINELWQICVMESKDVTCTQHKSPIIHFYMCYQV